MRTIYKRIDELNVGTIYLGYVGENEHTQVVLDCSTVFSRYPNAVPSVSVQPAMGKAYPAITTRSGNNVIWNVIDSDLTRQGTGKLQVTFTENGVVVKSCVGSTSIDESVIANSAAPEPINDWIAQANTVLNSIPQTIETVLIEAKESGAFNGPQGEKGDKGDKGDIGNAFTYSDFTSEQLAALTGPKGDKGDKGDPFTFDDFAPEQLEELVGPQGPKGDTGETGPQGPKGDKGDIGNSGPIPVLTIGTVTDVPHGTPSSATITGTAENPVLNLNLQTGASGNETIDDTAGIGDDDLVWSADKTQKELNEKADIIEVIDDTQELVKTFADGADNLPMALKIAMEPVQDLHGFDKPWLGGHGQNLLKLASSYEEQSGITCVSNPDTGEIVLNGKSTMPVSISLAQFDITSGESLFISGTPSNSASNYGIEVTFRGLNDLPVPYDDSPSTNIPGGGLIMIAPEDAVSIEVGARVSINIALSNIVIKPFVAKSTVAVPFSPYANICPINGWAGCDVARTGKNLITSLEYADNVYTTNFIKVTNGKKYILKGYKMAYGGPSIASRMYDINKQKIIRSTSISVSTPTYTFTANSDGYIRFSSSASTFNFDSKLQLEEGSSATTFEPFGQTYFIAFPETVYGGELTINKDGTGIIAADKVSVAFDGSNDEEWEKSNYNSMLLTDALVGRRGKNNTTRIYGISNMCETMDGGYLNEDVVAVSSISSDMLRVKQIDTNFDISDTSVDGWRAFLSSNPLQIVYELAEVITYPLTAPQVCAILGINNIWADTGKINEVQYFADTKKYTDKNTADKITNFQNTLIAPVLSDMKADIALSINDFRIVNGILYKVTANIASGGTLKVGTNVVETNLGELITAILNAN